MEETTVLLRAYARAQERCSRLLADQAAQIVRLRAALIVRDSTLAMVRERSVLCVGRVEERSGMARRLVEITGGRYLHHDGQDDADAAALESSLRAADLVICQTGCLSHDAYWRVQDHCRRTGKPCVMVGQDVAQPIRIVRRGAAVGS
ncbi:DUF2325 domain-containing protein [Variovorax sp. LT2P21]|uniref:DUF2325 domain-containing protein n=1 Tax=Variovorax sp. LT2P21 TaxID=3443731 RepID=UPI003F4901ED